MKNRFILGISISFIIAMSVLARTLSYSNVKDMKPTSEEAESVSPVINQEQSKVISSSNFDILSFDLGEMTIEDETNIIQIPLKGRFVVPQDEGEHPIVFIIPDLTIESDVSVAYDGILGKMSNLN